MKYTLLLLFLVFSAQADDLTFDKESGQAIPNYIGELKLSKGKVYKQKGSGKLLEVKTGTRFHKNDTLVTKDKSMAKLLIVDDTELTIAPNSELNFAEFRYVNKNDRSIVYSLLMGQIKADVKTKADEDDVIIKTKNATLGVRGTKILVNHQTLNNLEISEFALESGNASVTDQIKNIKHDLIKNQRIIVIRDAKTDESISEKNGLTLEELDLLKNDENFLPFFIPKNAKINSDLYDFLHKATVASVAIKKDMLSSQPNKKGPAPKGSFFNLQKLNEKLRENQKKR